MQKIFVWMILILAIGGVVLAPFAEINRPKADGIDRLVFFPSKYPNGDWSPKKLHFQDIYFSSADNTRLHGWYCPAENPVATILFAHGNAGNVASPRRYCGIFRPKLVRRYSFLTIEDTDVVLVSHQLTVHCKMRERLAQNFAVLQASKTPRCSLWARLLEEQ